MIVYKEYFKSFSQWIFKSFEFIFVKLLIFVVFLFDSEMILPSAFIKHYSKHNPDHYLLLKSPTELSHASFDLKSGESEESEVESANDSDLDYFDVPTSQMKNTKDFMKTGNIHITSFKKLTGENLYSPDLNPDESNESQCEIEKVANSCKASLLTVMSFNENNGTLNDYAIMDDHETFVKMRFQQRKENLTQILDNLKRLVICAQQCPQQTNKESDDPMSEDVNSNAMEEIKESE